MHKIVDQKRYDTKTAEMVCDISPSGYGRNDFRYEDTQLYRTKKGAWFIAGEGGPMTRWKHKCGDMWGYGSGLQVIDSDYAYWLLEEHGTPELIEQHFKVEEA